MTAAIELRGVRVEHGGHAVLRDVDFVVPRGAFVALIGPNGGGKTTLLRTLLGLKRPTAGKVRVMGAAPRVGRAAIGYVPQEVVVDAEFPISAAAVLRMGLVWQPRHVRTAAEPRVAELVRRLDLAALLERRYGALSGGEKRRVLIARALALDPELLLLDEPDAGVDPGHIEPIYDLLSENSQRTVLLATHDLSVVSTHVDAIACVNRTVVQHASAQVDAEMLRNLYGAGVEPLLHGPVRLLADHEDGHGHADFHARHHHGHAHHHHGGRCAGDGDDT
jgi:zinc transport system ATP-binding protein